MAALENLPDMSNRKETAVKTKKTLAAVVVVAGLLSGSTGVAVAEVNSGNRCGPGETFYWYTMPTGETAKVPCDGEGEPIGTAQRIDDSWLATSDSPRIDTVTAKAVDEQQG